MFLPLAMIISSSQLGGDNSFIVVLQAVHCLFGEHVLVCVSPVGGLVHYVADRKPRGDR
jgi:hypothetical protein